MKLHTATGWRSLLLSSLLCTPTLAKKDGPGIKKSEFEFEPRGLQYFDDSDVIMFEDRVGRVAYRSEDAGESWKPVSSVPGGKMLELQMHPFDNKKAYIIISDAKTHWKTSDRGKTWEKFFTDSMASIFRSALVFHAGDPDRMIFNAMDCTGIFCEELTYYTTDGFSGDAKFLRSDTDGCHWAKSTEIFTTGQDDLDKNRILCVAKGQASPWRKDFRLVVSDSYFTDNKGVTQEFEPELEPGRTVQGIVDVAVIKKYLITAASAPGTDEMAMYVSDDTIKWHRAIFPTDHKIVQNSYTILESTNYSIQIDVMNTRPMHPMGVFLSSNSNGTYFTRHLEHTNRNWEGVVDFEKVSGIQGIVIANTVSNWEKVLEKGEARKVKSEISFDDGRTFHGLKVGDDSLHLHSVTQLSNSGRVYSSPAPGLVMGIGNTGDYLKAYSDGNLYVSDNAGATWRLGLEGPHKYEFGDQGSILVAIKDPQHDKVKTVDVINYSLDHGKNWIPAELGFKIRPGELTTTKDSTSLKFLLEGIEDSDRPTAYIVALDFDDLHEGKCKDSDMEDWHARVDEKGNPTCLMGHTQTYRRRKADADCFVKSEFVDPVPITTSCECTDDDFECDFNFVRSDDRKDCVPAGPLVVPEGQCKDPKGKFKGSSGWRLIPGNDCKRTSGAQKDALVEHDCSGSVAAPASGKIGHNDHDFPGDHFLNKIYLERTGLSTGDDETIITRTEQGVFLSHDHGKTWIEPEILKKQKIAAIISNPYFNDMVFFITETAKVFYSIDRGDNIRSFTAPAPPGINTSEVVSFHPKHKDWFIWIGSKDCDGDTPSCHNIAYVTQDRGDTEWATLQRYVSKCEFIKEPNRKLTKEEHLSREKLVYCQAKEKEDNDPTTPMKLISSDNFFSEDTQVHLKNLVGFATMSEFIVAASREEGGTALKASASIDGDAFADAKFPHGFIVDHKEAYTVLDSSTHAVFLHVTVNNERGLEYGTILKSNSNGTDYVLSLNGVDRDKSGYVDFEKLLGLEGVALVNVVANYNSKSYKKDGKKLKTMITHNDGAEWDYLQPPKLDADGKKFKCNGNLDKCSLNIHGYTERRDKGHYYYSQSAIGLMMATGNVGEYLNPMLNDFTVNGEVGTFMTADGGITWKAVKTGQYMWEFGDQGSIIVIVKDNQKTKVVHYSLDEGDTWNDYEFSSEEIMITDITTVPSDNSRNFLLWGNKKKLITINLDFTGLTDHQCKLDENNVEAGDYYLWRPKHPKQDNDCLFGHISEYHRKKIDSKCFNGKMIPHLHDVSKNCTCTRQDFECDFNFERQTDGSCALIKGFSPPDHSIVCKQDASVEEYYDYTGYRRIPMTTCDGGQMLDVSTAHPCPGFEDDFIKKHGPSAAGIFFAVTIPIAVACAVGFWVWRNWEGKFGQIRLGEQSSFDNEAPWVKYPVMAIAALVAVIVALPILASSLWRSVSGALGRGSGTRFTTRDSFARGRGDYAVVDDDEGELLGEDSDEEAV